MKFLLSLINFSFILRIFHPKDTQFGHKFFTYVLVNYQSLVLIQIFTQWKMKLQVVWWLSKAEEKKENKKDIWMFLLQYLLTSYFIFYLTLRKKQEKLAEQHIFGWFLLFGFEYSSIMNGNVFEWCHYAWLWGDEPVWERAVLGFAILP